MLPPTLLRVRPEVGIYRLAGVGEGLPKRVQIDLEALGLGRLPSERVDIGKPGEVRDGNAEVDASGRDAWIASPSAGDEHECEEDPDGDAAQGHGVLSLVAVAVRLPRIQLAPSVNVVSNAASSPRGAKN